MINEATLRMARYYPELIPDTAESNIPVGGAEVAPPILDLRRFSPLFLQFTNLAVDRDVNVEVRLRADRTREAIAAGTLTGIPGGVLGGIAPNRFDILGRDNLYYNLFSTAIEASLRSSFGLWVYQPTVAHKLKMGMTLTPDERRLNEELGIANTVEKGLLPLPLSAIIEREYQVIEEITRGYVMPLVPAIPVVVNIVHSRIDEFIVLTGIAADPGTSPQN